MNRIQEQSAKLWQLLTASDTADSYQKALQVTVEIFKEIALLIWLLFCLILVVGEWFWKGSIRLGQNSRAWLSGIEGGSPDRLASEAGQALLSASKDSLTYTLTQAKVQLGIPFNPEPPKVESAKVEPAQPSVTIAAPPAVTVTSPTPMVSPKPPSPEPTKPDSALE